MVITADPYSIIRDRITISDIVKQKVHLVKKSKEYLGLCPFHFEKTPSFTVNDIKKFYHCFGCNAHGDVINFIAVTASISYKDAAIKLAEDYRIELPNLNQTPENLYLYKQRSLIFSILEMATNFFQSENKNYALEYLTSRNITSDMVKEFKIGFAPIGDKLTKFFLSKSISISYLEQAGLVGKKDNGQIYEIFQNRIIFPIKNSYGKTVGFGGRVISNYLPKYLNSPETFIFKKSKILYGEDKAFSFISKINYSILVEGYLDVITLHSFGFREAVASLGTSVNEEHIKKLWSICDEVIVCLDGDPAGFQATKRIVNLILPLINSQKKISFILLKNSNDPDKILRSKGKKFFKELINNRLSLSKMIWLIEYQGEFLDTPEKKAEIENNLIEYVKQIRDFKLKFYYRKFFYNQIWENLIKNQSKKDKIDNILALSKENAFSEFQLIEYAIIYLIIKFPQILENDDSKQFVLNINSENDNFHLFIKWLTTYLAIQKDYKCVDLKLALENSGFGDIFLLLKNIKHLFFYQDLNISNYAKFFDYLKSKHYLIKLKNEYQKIAQCESDKAFKKAIYYQQEILKVLEQIKNLGASIN